jgi:pimeloyl-ACP methyl ester carboxylesterase
MLFDRARRRNAFCVLWESSRTPRSNAGGSCVWGRPRTPSRRHPASGNRFDRTAVQPEHAGGRTRRQTSQTILSSKSAWPSEGDLDYYAKEFARTGFRGGLNWYRGQDISWQETPFLIGRKLLQPTLYIAGEDDPTLELGRPAVDSLETSVPNLWKKVLLPGVGHFTEQEAPGEVNRLMMEFLHSIDDVKNAPSK